jgi:hypothetical protein
MKFQNFARPLALMTVAISACVLVATPVRGQDSPEQPDDTKAVVRISKQLIEDVVAREEIVAAVPFRATVLGFCCQGVIYGQAKLSVELITGQGEAHFVVYSRGTARTCVRGVRGPIVATGPAWGPFATQTLVDFDGRKFAMVETTPWAQVHAELESVEGRRGGCVGRAVGHMLRPVGQLLMPHAERQGTPIGEDILWNLVDEIGEKILTILNRTTAVEKSLNRVFPESKDWVFQLSSDAQFIQAAYGPRASAVPVLPENPGRLKDVRLELWLHSTTKEAKDLAKLSKVPLAKALVHKYIETILPEVAALSENRSVDAVGPWLVISIGAPKEE